MSDMHSDRDAKLGTRKIGAASEEASGCMDGSSGTGAAGCRCCLMKTSPFASALTRRPPE